MRFRVWLGVFGLTCAMHAQAPVPPAKTTASAAGRSEPNLSPAFSAAGLTALRAIEYDKVVAIVDADSLPSDQEPQLPAGPRVRPAAKLPKGLPASDPAHQLLQTAELEGHSTEEKAVVSLLHHSYAQRALDNGVLKLLREQLVTGRAPSIRINNGTVASTVSPDLVAQSIDAKQHACFAALDSLLRVRRFTVVPVACDSWLSPTARKQDSSNPPNLKYSAPPVFVPPITANSRPNTPIASPTIAQQSPQPVDQLPPSGLPQSMPPSSTAGSVAGKPVAPITVIVERNPIAPAPVRDSGAAPALHYNPQPAPSRPPSEHPEDKSKGAATAAPTEKKPTPPAPSEHSAASANTGQRQELLQALRDYWWMFPLVAVGIGAMIFLRRFQQPPLKGRLVIERSGLVAADINFQELDTSTFRVLETSEASKRAESLCTISTGRDGELFTLEMRREAEKWLPFVQPADVRLREESGRFLENEVMPAAQWIMLEGKQLRVIHYY